jgi:hypothetical protein
LIQKKSKRLQVLETGTELMRDVVEWTLKTDAYPLHSDRRRYWDRTMKPVVDLYILNIRSHDWDEALGCIRILRQLLEDTPE